MTPDERRAWLEKTSVVADMRVLEGLGQPTRRDGGHRLETWAQVYIRIEQLAELKRTQRLAELNALKRAADTQS